MTPEFESRIYGEVLRDVLWGTRKADVVHKLEVNGFSPEQAEEVFQRAWEERLREIRNAALRKAAKGLALVLAGVAVVCFFWFGAGALPRGAFVLSFFGCAFGGYWLIDGGVEAILAERKSGPVGGVE
jgi:hypothetical protein